ncbi:MAG: hypothetical protein HKN67_06285 [Saprospiraceae bacterium]|nr:hypothetical protein [Saprospiraceae bacterium]
MSIISLFLLYAASFPSLAQYDLDSLYENDPEFKIHFDSIRDTFSIFDNDESLRIVLKSDFKNLNKKKYDREYQEAEMQVHIFDSLVATRTIKIQPRGNNRLTTCYYPPLKVNFKKGDMLINQLKEFDKIKLVKPCKNGVIYEDFLENEYLIYKVYQILEPDYSYRVRKLEVTYIDTSGKIKTKTAPSFVIENDKQLAKRTNSIPIEVKGLNYDYIDRKRADVMSVFQFMIGNTDWSLAGLHNMILLKDTDPNKDLVVAVPYDFDYSGIVNTGYAVPNEKLGIETVRERLYRGFCGEEGDIKSAVELVYSRKEEILSLYSNFQFSRESYKQGALKYLNEFFTIAGNERLAKTNIISRCR